MSQKSDVAERRAWNDGGPTESVKRRLCARKNAMFTIKKIDHVAVLVEDIDRAVAKYQRWAISADHFRERQAQIDHVPPSIRRRSEARDLDHDSEHEREKKQDRPS